MKWFVLFVGVVVVCFFAALVLGLVGGGLGRTTSSLSHEPLPDDELSDSDVEQLHFDVGLRGYRMSQVDGVVDRLRRELREKDEQIGVLRGDPAPPLPGGIGDTGDKPTATEPIEPDDRRGLEPTEPTELTELTELTDEPLTDEQPEEAPTERQQPSEPTV